MAGCGYGLTVAKLGLTSTGSPQRLSLTTYPSSPVTNIMGNCSLAPIYYRYNGDSETYYIGDWAARVTTRLQPQQTTANQVPCRFKSGGTCLPFSQQAAGAKQTPEALTFILPLSLSHAYCLPCLSECRLVGGLRATRQGPPVPNMCKTSCTADLLLGFWIPRRISLMKMKPSELPSTICIVGHIKDGHRILYRGCNCIMGPTLLSLYARCMSFRLNARSSESS